MVLIEGPDGAGKTTLVKRLQADFPLKTGVRGTENRDLLWTVTRGDTYNALKWAIDPEERPRIWDRLFYSEMVYAPLMDRECEFNATEQMFFTRMLAALHCPVLLCLPPLMIVRENAGLDHQMEGVTQKIDNIHRAYVELVEDGFFPEHVKIYDYTQDEDGAVYDELVTEIDDYLKDRRERMR